MDFAYVNYFWYFLGTLGLISFMGCLFLLGKVKKSVGFDFMNAIAKAKMLGLKNSSVVVLRIRDLVGNEQYTVKEASEFIQYSYKQNNQLIIKNVIYNERAVTIWNGVKVLNVSPTSILPVDRDTGSYVNINPELTNKIVTDAGKTSESETEKKEMMKHMLWLTGIVIVGLILVVSYFYQNQVDLMNDLKVCYAGAKGAATIITGK